MYLGRRKRGEKKISPCWPSMPRSSKLPIYTRPRSTTIKGFSPVCPPEVGPRSRPRVHRVCIHAPRSRPMIVNCAFDRNHHRPSFLVPRPYVFSFFLSLWNLHRLIPLLSIFTYTGCCSDFRIFRIEKFKTNTTNTGIKRTLQIIERDLSIVKDGLGTGSTILQILTSSKLCLKRTKA